MHHVELTNPAIPEFQGRPPQEIMEWAWATYGERLMMTTAFGYSGMVLAHMISSIAPSVPIYFINTGFHFSETLKFRDYCRNDLRMNVIDLNPEVPRGDFLDKYGHDIMKHNPDFCCARNKVAPLQKVLDERRYDAWIAALRRDQADTRKQIPVVERLPSGMTKIHPLAEWDKRLMWKYITTHKVPYHPLHDEGYMSIGCEPCTTKPGAGAHERDGRWAGNEKVECGLHMIDRAGEIPGGDDFRI